MSDGPFSPNIPRATDRGNMISGAREVSTLELSTMRISGHVDYLNTIAMRLENAADAIFGSQPQAPSAGLHGEASKPFSKMDGLNQAIDGLERVLYRIERAQERLSTL